MVKVKWTTKTPTVEGWYWMRYKNKRRTITQCPAYVAFAIGATVVQSAFNDKWIEGPNHGGKGLKYMGKIDKSIRFGPKLEEVE